MENKDIELKNLKDISELRDKLIRAKTMAESQKEKTKEAVKAVKQVLSNVPKETIEQIRIEMPEIIGVFEPDYTRLENDEEYLESYKTTARSFIAKVRDKLNNLLQDGN